MGKHSTTLQSVIEAIRNAPLAPLLEGRGVRRRGNSWHCPFHRDRTPSASIYRNRLHCFRCDESWGAVDFVIRQDGLDFKTAIRVIADFYGIPFADVSASHEQRREYAKRRTVAESEARGLLAWRDHKISALRDIRDSFLGAYHRAKNHVLTHGPDSLPGEFAMQVAEVYEVRYQELDACVDSLLAMPWPELLRRYRAERQAVA